MNITIILLTLAIGLTTLCGQLFLYDAILWLREVKASYKGILEHDTDVFPDLYEHDTLYGATRPQ